LAFVASVFAPSFQAFSRASWKVIFSILVLELDLAVLLAQALKHLLRERGDGLRGPAPEVFVLESMQFLHA